MLAQRSPVLDANLHLPHSPRSAGAVLSDTRILVPGRNCWRHELAQRVAVVIDSAAYFDALAAAVERAQRSIFVLSWDFHGDVPLRHQSRDLVPGPQDQGFGSLLCELVEKKRGLRVHVLNWDYPPLLYTMERQMLPTLRLDRWTHRHFHYRLDDNHPMGGSHHQKIVVIDDALAFVGGIDIALSRWDTSDHCANDPRRVNPAGDAYGPYHDLMVAVDGAAAAAIGELARERWRRATGWRLRPAPVQSDPWPRSLRPDFENVRVAIARTDPPFEDRPAVREVETLYLDAIAAARRSIYIENQYLTATRVGEALCARLQEADGPEVVAVCTQMCGGWLEEGTMGVLRARLVEKLRAADVHGRLRLLCPNVPDLCDTKFSVHAKLLIIDDVLLRVGSANLNNRSMGLDTECDVAIEAGRNPLVARKIAEIRHKLLAEHLDVPVAQVAAAVEQQGSLIAAIEQFGGAGRCLKALDPSVPAWLEGMVPDSSVVDPDEPIDSAAVVARIASFSRARRHENVPWVGLALFTAACLVLWHFTSAREWINPGRIAAHVQTLRASPLAPLAVLGTFVLSSLAFAPVTVLIVATVLGFGPWLGALYASLGALLAACVNFAIGRSLGRDAVRRLVGRHGRVLTRHLQQRGLLAMLTVRLLPVAPFTVVNLMAGMAGVSFRHFALGTLFGMAPGIIGIALSGPQILRAVRSPSLSNILGVMTLVVLVVGGLVWLARLAARRRSKSVSERVVTAA